MSKKLNQIIMLTALTPVRHEQFDGRDHLVAPVVILVEGVHSGSLGPTYYSTALLESAPASWNGIPLPVMHPMDGDNFVSANTPGIIDAQSIGRLFNVEYEADKARLVGEVWIDVLKAQKISPAALDAVQQGKKLEVSTSMFSAGDGTSGEWNGEEYMESVTTYRPDHLALLPGAIGACSIADGCGMNNNEKKKSLISKTIHYLKSLIDNEDVSHDDIRDKLQGALDKTAGEQWSFWIREVFDDYLIFEGSSLEISTETGIRKLYQQSYIIGSDDQVTLANDRIEVVEKTEYIPVTNDGDTNKELIMKKDELVASLIACCHNKLTEADKEWLGELPEKQLETMSVLSKEKQVDFNKPVDGIMQVIVNAEPVVNADPPKDKPVVNDDSTPETADEYVSKAPPEVQATLRRALDNDRAIKDARIKDLLANKNCTFTEDQLKAKEIDELEALAKLANIDNDYSLSPGSPVANVDDENEIPPMPSTFDKVKEKQTA